MKNLLLCFALCFCVSVAYCCTLTVISSTSATVGCNGQAKILKTNCAGACNYLLQPGWVFHQTGPNSDTIVIDSICAGTWTFAMNCDTSFGYCVVNILFVGVNEAGATSHFTVSPNPVTNQLNISLLKPVTQGTITIFNIAGQKVYSGKLTGSEKTIDCKLTKGIYFVQISDAKEAWATKILIE